MKIHGIVNAQIRREPAERVEARAIRLPATPARDFETRVEHRAVVRARRHFPRARPRAKLQGVVLLGTKLTHREHVRAKAALRPRLRAFTLVATLVWAPRRGDVRPRTTDGRPAERLDVARGIHHPRFPAPERGDVRFGPRTVHRHRVGASSARTVGEREQTVVPHLETAQCGASRDDARVVERRGARADAEIMSTLMAG